MPRLNSRVIAPGASLVCSVLSTRWPVSAACVASRAVSASRISPTMMTSGSCRSSDRSALANVKPAFSFTWNWLTPASSYSTGSSTVQMFTSSRSAPAGTA